MPKITSEIDYSNTIIYKITCKDTSIQELYVGHTTNFVQRKRAHKQSCVNPKSPNHNCKLYSTIRENGGWKNWIMDIVHFFNCNNQCEARTVEQEYFVLLKATLNSVEPMPSIKIVPKPTIKTVPNMNETLNSPKTYHCELCNLSTCSSKDYNTHLSTRKHKIMTNDTTLISKSPTIHSCNCGKTYKFRQGLALHKKKCNPIQDTSNNFVIDKEFVMSILKQNADIMKENGELTNLMMEVVKTKQLLASSASNNPIEKDIISFK
jgi:hypothetical protein